MSGDGENEPVFEIAVVVTKRRSREGGGSHDCVEVLVNGFEEAGLQVERVTGIGNEEFIKLGAPLKTFGRAAKELNMKKPTRFGMDLQFEWEEMEAFVRQPDGSMFSWFERFHCYHHLIYGIVNNDTSVVTLKFNGKAVNWESGESLLTKLESEGIVKHVFPLHDETKRKKLLRNWAFNWWSLTEQPIDEIYSYYGTKIAIYFTFLGMYTRWMVFPAVFGIVLQMGGFRSLELLIPVFFATIILWAVLFFQFWKRKNSAVLARWQISYSFGASQGYKHLITGGRSSHRSPLDLEFLKSLTMDKKKQKAMYQRHEWLGCLMRFRNDAIVILSIVCLQLPFELAYAHLYEVVKCNAVKYGITASYLLLIQYFTRIGGKLSVKLIKHENNENTEYQADSLVYKVFGLYFMQSYIGVFYHAYLHRNFMSLRQVLIQRLIVASVLDNLLENSLPYIVYKFKRYTAVKNKHKGNQNDGSPPPNRKGHFSSRVEKEYLKPAYSATIGEELEDGLFNDFLELTLQFGMIMMFACAFPVIFAFALFNNIMEIRTDSLKLLAMLRRPVPRAATTIGAWLNIFQFLIVMAIVSNSVLLVCLYDREGTWKIEPGLAGILIMEHCLLLIKFGFSGFVPEEPAWVRANRMKHESQAMDVCSRQLLRCISEEQKEQLVASKKNL